MVKTKAAFRAVREECGLSQQDVADAAGVRVLAVKRWESPAVDGHRPPDDAWEWLLAMRDGLRREAAEAAEATIAALREAGEDEAVVMYYRSQGHLDSRAGEGRPYGYVNATSREAARIIEASGHAVAYRYAGTGGRGAMLVAPILADKHRLGGRR